MKMMIVQVTLYVPKEMTVADTKDFVEKALQSEPGHYMPEDPQSEVQLIQVLSHRG